MSLIPAIKTLFAQLPSNQQMPLLRELENSINQANIGTTPVKIRLEVLPANNADTMVLGLQAANQQIHQTWIDGGLVKSYT